MGIDGNGFLYRPLLVMMHVILNLCVKVVKELEKNTNTHKTALRITTFSHRYQQCTKELAKLQEI